MTKEDAVKKIEELGGKLKDAKTAVLAVSNCGEVQLEVIHTRSKSQAMRRYVFYERDMQTEKSMGEFTKEHMLSPGKAGDINRMKDLILDMTGDYQGKMDSILKCMGIIEQYRVLKFDDSLDFGRLGVMEIIQAMKDWMLLNPLDEGIVTFEVGGRKEVAFRKGSNGFDKVFYEVAPENEIEQFKKTCQSSGYLKTSEGRGTYRVQINTAHRLNIPGGRVIMFNSDTDRQFVEMYYAARERAEAEQKTARGVSRPDFVRGREGGYSA